MQPGANDVHVDKLLTNLSISYQNADYISDRIFPVVMVNNRSGIVPRYDKSAWFRDEVQELAPMQAAPIGGYTVDTTMTYYARKYGFGTEVPDEVRANADMPFRPDQESMELSVDKMDLHSERKFVSDFWATSKWTTDLTGGSSFTKWSSYATSTPIHDVRDARRTLRRLIQRNANVFVLGDFTFDVLCDHPDLLDRVKYGASSAAPALVTENLLAQLWSFEDVLVGTSMYTADPEGTAEASVTYTSNWDDDGLILFRPKRPSLRTPAAGYTIVWRTVFGGRRFVRKRREPVSALGDLIEVYEFYEQKMTAPDAGVFLSDAVD